MFFLPVVSRANERTNARTRASHDAVPFLSITLANMLAFFLFSLSLFHLADISRFLAERRRDITDLHSTVFFRGLLPSRARARARTITTRLTTKACLSTKIYIRFLKNRS